MNSSTELLSTPPAAARPVARPRTGMARRAVRAPQVETAAFRSVQELELEAQGPPPVDEAELALVEAIRRQAYAEGFAQGRGEGFEAGAAEAAQQVIEAAEPVLGALVAAAQDLQQRDAVTLAELDDVVVGFAMDVARTVVGHDLAAETDPGRAAIARAIGLAPDRGDVVVRLHPDDIATLGEVDTLAPGRGIEVVTDASVQPGGCLLDVGACRVDAQIAPALARVATVLGLNEGPAV
jgi:flagellar assembly protein FliH